MHEKNNLNPADLSLLPILEALIEERHVSRAALRLHRSQPAVSHALARLRDLFQDPLLVRGGGGLQPTARALQLAEPLGEALALLRSMLDQQRFDPAQCRRHIRLSLSDYGAAILLPELIPRLRHAAPLMDISVVSYGRDRALAALTDGEIELAVGVYPALRGASQGDLRSALLFEEDFACLFDGTGGQGALSLGEYLARPHLRVAVAWQDDSEVDDALARLGHKRRVAVQIPHWSAAPGLVRGTDLVLTAARRSIEPLGQAGLRCGDLPFRLNRFPFVQTWHRRRDKDAPHRWLRDEISRIAAAGGQSPQIASPAG